MKIYKNTVLGCMLSVLFLLMAFSSAAYGGLYWESVQVRTGEPKGLPEGFPKGMPKGLPKDLPKDLPQGMGKDMPKPPPRPGRSHGKSGPETMKHYLTSYASRVETKDDITIVLFDEMIIYQLDPSTGTYVKINMKEMEKNMGPMAKMQENATVKDTGETDTIEGFKCEKYIMTFMGVENAQWLSRDVPGYGEYKKISSKITKDSPQFRRMGLSGKLSGKGFPVKMETNVMGMTTTTTLKKIEERKLSKDLFKVPEGYVQKPLNLPFHR